MAQSVPKVPGMDGLRGLAALCVFAVHYNQMVGLEFTLWHFDLATFMANGKYGVSLFFSLSGFLLSIPFWNAQLYDAPSPVAINFYARRACRILPAYYLVLTCLIVWDRRWLLPGALFDNLSHYVFIFNFAEFSIFSISPQFWTIAVELQFYLLLPVLFIVTGRVSGKLAKPLIILVLLITCTALQPLLLDKFNTVISWPFNPWLTWISPNGPVLNFSLLATLPHFLIGTLTAYLFLELSREKSRSMFIKKHSEIFFWLSFLTIFVLLSTGWSEEVSLSSIPYGYPLVPSLIALLILSLPFTKTAQSLLDKGPFSQIGKISYGVYLIHYPCLSFIELAMRKKNMDVSNYWFAYGIGTLACTLILAMISYQIVEKPFLLLRRRK